MRLPLSMKICRLRKIVTLLAVCFLSMLAIVLWDNASSTVMLSSSLNSTHLPHRVNSQRALLCSGCFKSDFPLTLDQADLCKTENNQTIDVIFLVVTSYRGLPRRQAVRETWASVTRNNTSNFRHVFLFGSTSDIKLQQDVIRESVQFRDVLVSGFHDSYNNLTLKTMMGLRWAVTRCRHARFFVKVDDDVWVNTLKLMTVIEKRREDLEHGVGGKCKTDQPINRDKHSRWYISPEDFPEPSYPPYCLGLAYVGGMGVAVGVVAKSKDVPFFHLEDVYVGMCLREAGLDIVRMTGFNYHVTHPNVCMVKNFSIATHGVYADQMRYYWNHTCQM